MDVALEVVLSRFVDGFDLVGGGVRGCDGLALEEGFSPRGLVDPHIMDLAGVLVVELDGERLPRRGCQAVRVEPVPRGPGWGRDGQGGAARFARRGGRGRSP